MRTTFNQVLGGMRGAENLLKEGRKIVQSVTAPTKIMRSKGDRYLREVRQVKILLGSAIMEIQDDALKIPSLLYLIEHVDEIELIDILPSSKNFFVDKVRKALGWDTQSQSANDLQNAGNVQDAGNAQNAGNASEKFPLKVRGVCFSSTQK